MVAALQGLLGGLVFRALGVGAPLLWGVLMAFLSLVPAVGAALVRAPVALYFLVAGALRKGVVPTTTLGGMSVLGINGFVLGPVVAAMFMALWHIHGSLHSSVQQRTDGDSGGR